MRGRFTDQGGLFSYIAPDKRVPANDPLRKVRELVRDVLSDRRQSDLALPRCIPPMRVRSPSMMGQNSSTIASVVIEPTRPFDQNTLRSPPEPIIDRRKASSARLPSTSASVNGASGMPIFLKT